MEAANGVDFDHAHVGLEKVPEMDGLGQSVNKENENVDICDNSVQLTAALEDPSKAEGISSSGIEGGVCVRAMKSKSLKKPGSNRGDWLKNNKEQMDKVGRNGLTGIPRNQRAVLSKSVSFPSKGVPTNGLRKSTTDVKQLKHETKGCQMNSTEVPSSGSNVLLLSKRTSLASKSNAVRPSALKSASVDATARGTASEALQSATSRVGSQRSSVCGFSFKLDERAEKRKEFFQKLEEKTHAKEVEKTNFQAKSKEDQEAEIKQLRKSLTFKATPMPNFYKEPGPPKVELKKIPTTRAISPKLGRHKSSTSASENNVPNRSSCSSFHPSKSSGSFVHGNRGSLASKRPIQRSPLKLPSQKSTVTKPGTKPLSMKAKVLGPNNEAEIAKLKVKENMDQVLWGNPAEVVDSVSLNTAQTCKGEGEDEKGETTIVAFPNYEISTLS